MKHILVGVSYSNLTNVTLKYALKVAQYFGAKLTVLHVAKPTATVTFEDDLSKIEGLRAEKLATLQSTFNEFYGKQFHNVAVEFVVNFGKPSDVLITQAQNIAPDLLVIGVPENKFWGKLRFINTPMEIADAVQCPVLLVPITGTFQSIRQIVYATNFSLEDVGAMMDLKIWMDIFGTKLHCVHICPSEKGRAAATRKMNILEKVFNDDRYTFTIEVGDDAAMLKSHLVADKANLVVMLKRSKALWYDTVKPTLTEKIADNTWIPLLIYNQK